MIFSLHGTEKTHDYITGVPNSYDIVVQSIRRAKEQGFFVEIHTVPMKVNYLEIPTVIAKAHELKVDKISLLRHVPQGRSKDHNDLKMTADDYIILRRLLSEVKNKDFIRLGAPFSCLFPAKNNCCSAGKNKLLIGFNGDSYPCEVFKEALKNKVSNIYINSLEDIWAKDLMLNKIRALPVDDISACNDCKNVKTCKGGCHGQRLIHNGSIFFGPDPICQADSF
jgi:radical SAM protein with 4Fe4S-binding SPASM domain